MSARRSQHHRKMLRTGRKLLCHHHQLQHRSLNTSAIKTVAATKAAVKTVVEHEEYEKEAKYPAIKELSFRSNLLKRRTQWYDHIRDLGTVEEKLLAINQPRYYGYKSVMLNDKSFGYNSLPFIQHSTRTSLDTDGGLSTLQVYRHHSEEEVQKLVDDLKADVLDAIQFEMCGYEKNEDAAATSTTPEGKREKCAGIVGQINRVIFNGLVDQFDHLNEVEIDVDVRHEAFWMIGGISPPTLTRKKRLGTAWQKDMADEPVNRAIQYIGSPLLTVRHQNPLPAMESTNESAAAPPPPPPAAFTYDPRTIGYAHDYRHGTTIPGFWPGSRHQFGHLSFIDCSQLVDRNRHYGPDELQESIHSLAIASSYSWLLGQACYQGFSTFTELTYPLTTQTIITDGQHWSFYAYQLNTTQVHQDALAENPKVNRCWSSSDGELKLFEEISANGEVVGFNEDVLRQLIRFYLLRPEPRANVEMTPYLSAAEPIVADIVDPERREFLEQRFKHLMSNRPRHRLTPEIYHWEKIYKIDNVTKPLDPKRRFYELGVNPFGRRLDDHTPVYIPKVLRPGGPKSKEKWQKKFYPSPPK